jgi:hypothetical protein
LIKIVGRKTGVESGVIVAGQRQQKNGLRMQIAFFIPFKLSDLIGLGKLDL